MVKPHIVSDLLCWNGALNISKSCKVVVTVYKWGLGEACYLSKTRQGGVGLPQILSLMFELTFLIQYF